MHNNVLSNFRILFIDEVHPILKEKLLAEGCDCDEFYNYSLDQILEIIDNYHGVVIRSKFKIDEPFLNQAKKLKFIARSGSGMENINITLAKKLGIECINSPEGNRDAVAEHCMAMILCLFNKLINANQIVRKGKWLREQNRGIELKNKTVGIIGYGHMGSAFAERLQSFGCNILAHDKYKFNFANQSVTECSLDLIYQNADIVSIHLPLNSETHHYIDEHFINKMQKPFYIINTSRGNQLKTVALIDALKNGKVLGACLDVLEFEASSFMNIENNESFIELSNFSNLIFTPHVAGWTEESYYKLSSFLFDKIKQTFA